MKLVPSFKLRISHLYCNCHSALKVLLLSYSISSKVGHQSIPFSFQDLINVAKQLASERECSPTETLPVCIQLLRHALYRRVFALACSAADNLLMFANVKVDFVFHYVKIFCAKRKKRKI